MVDTRSSELDAVGGCQLERNFRAGGCQLRRVGHTQYCQIIHHIPNHDLRFSATIPAGESDADILRVRNNVPVGGE